MNIDKYKLTSSNNATGLNNMLIGMLDFAEEKARNRISDDMYHVAGGFDRDRKELRAYKEQLIDMIKKVR